MRCAPQLLLPKAYIKYGDSEILPKKLKKYQKQIDLNLPLRLVFSVAATCSDARDSKSVAVSNYPIGFLVPSNQAL